MENLGKENLQCFFNDIGEQELLDDNHILEKEIELLKKKYFAIAKVRDGLLRQAGPLSKILKRKHEA